MSFIAAAGLAVGVGGVVAKGIQRGKANKRLSELQTKDPIYKENPMAAQRLGLANSLLNARMPGASSIEKNIYTSGANATGQFNRNAGDSTQALLGGAAIAGQTGSQLNNLGIEENQDYQRRYGNQVAAQQGVINEGDKVFQDQTRRFGDTAQIQGAQEENKASTWSDISNLGFGLADFSLAGGMQGMGGGVNAGRNAYRMPRQQYNPQSTLPYINH